MADNTKDSIDYTDWKSVDTKLENVDHVSHFQNVHGECFLFLFDTGADKGELWGDELGDSHLELSSEDQPEKELRLPSKPYVIKNFILGNMEAIIISAYLSIVKQRVLMRKG